MTSTFKPKASIPDESSKDDFTTSRIYRAIRKGDFLRVLSAIQKGENPYLIDSKACITYLHLVVIMCSSATEDRFLPMVYILSNYGIDINKQDKRGRTALELAINKELKNIIVALIRVGIDLTEKDYKALIQSVQSSCQSELLDIYTKYEPGLWGAVKKNNVGLVHMLINSWCRINTTKNSRTLIQYAKLMRKSPEIIQLLIDYDATIELVHATLAGDEQRMAHFLSEPRGADPHIMDISHQEGQDEPLTPQSLRDTAIQMGHTHILHLLPDGNSDSSDDDDNYDTGVMNFNLEEDDDHNIDEGDERQRNIQESTQSDSEYSSSLATSADNISYPFENDAEKRSSNRNKSIKTLHRSQYDHNFHYYKSFEGEQEAYHPDHMIHLASLSAREYRMNWDSDTSYANQAKKVKHKSKSKKSKLLSKKLSSDFDATKSKMCVIS